MSIYTGASEAQAVKIGSQDASAVYVGSEQVWPTSNAMEAYASMLWNVPSTLYANGPLGFEGARASMDVYFDLGTNNAATPFSFYYEFDLEFLEPPDIHFQISPYSYADSSPAGFPLTQNSITTKSGGGVCLYIHPDPGKSYKYEGSTKVFDDNLRNGGRISGMFTKSGTWNSSYSRLGLFFATPHTRIRVSNWAVSQNVPIRRQILSKIKDAKDNKRD